MGTNFKRPELRLDPESALRLLNEAIGILETSMPMGRMDASERARILCKEMESRNAWPASFSQDRRIEISELFVREGIAKARAVQSGLYPDLHAAARRHLTYSTGRK